MAPGPTPPPDPPRLDDIDALGEPDPSLSEGEAWRRWQTWGPFGLGLAYGLVARFLIGLDAAGDLFGVMSIGFIFFVPLAIGFVTVYALPEPLTWGRALSAPLVPVLLTLLGALVLLWEGLICVVVWLPLAAVLGMVGGGIAAVVRRIDTRRRSLVLVSAAALPFLVAPVEAQFDDPVQGRVVEDVVEIEAPAAVVWEQIREVPAIAAAELGPSFAHAVGFPRPIEARLVGTGVGSVRYATFEGDVTFVERVTDWDEPRELAFAIDASAVPATTFDEHVAVGGRYFDVLEGRYRIREVAPGRVALSLSSTHRLSTRFNAYTRIWTDLFMRDIQQNILDVIRERSEAAARGDGPER